QSRSAAPEGGGSPVEAGRGRRRRPCPWAGPQRSPRRCRPRRPRRGRRSTSAALRAAVNSLGRCPRPRRRAAMGGPRGEPVQRISDMPAGSVGHPRLIPLGDPEGAQGGVPLTGQRRDGLPSDSQSPAAASATAWAGAPGPGTGPPGAPAILVVMDIVPASDAVEFPHLLGYEDPDALTQPVNSTGSRQHLILITGWAQPVSRPAVAARAGTAPAAATPAHSRMRTRAADRRCRACP
ncbi:MAG: hypothetical protein JWL99_6169, partial [Streptomyces oryziradicis]|nr:hypothetical protein [Actinacidiphila oryziradicis]